LLFLFSIFTRIFTKFITNLCRYYHNDPFNRIDPDGQTAIGKIISYISGVIRSEKSVKELKTMEEAVAASKAGEASTAGTDPGQTRDRPF